LSSSGSRDWPEWGNGEGNRGHAGTLLERRQSEALAATTAEYRRLSPSATGDKLAVSGEVNRMIAAATNADSRWFWEGPDA
jgi:hypothetical protein